MRTETETEEGIAQAIVNSEVDFERDPWPKVSENAKDLVRSMLDPNPYSRLTAQEVLGMHFNYLWPYTFVPSHLPASSFSYLSQFQYMSHVCRTL